MLQQLMQAMTESQDQVSSEDYDVGKAFVIKDEHLDELYELRKSLVDCKSEYVEYKTACFFLKYDYMTDDEINAHPLRYAFDWSAVLQPKFAILVPKPESETSEPMPLAHDSWVAEEVDKL